MYLPQNFYQNEAIVVILDVAIAHTKQKHMEKTLYMKGESTRKPIIQHDDLKYDGKNLIIPGFWVSTIADYIKAIDETKINEDDKQDLETFKNFIYDVEYTKIEEN